MISRVNKKGGQNFRILSMYCSHVISLAVVQLFGSFVSLLSGLYVPLPDTVQEETWHNDCRAQKKAYIMVSNACILPCVDTHMEQAAGG